MNMEEIWQENKSFILMLLAGVVVFSIAYMVIDSSFSADISKSEGAARRARASAKSKDLRRGVSKEMERRRDELSSELEVLEKELTFRPRPGFTFAGVTRSHDIYFNEMMQKLLKETVEPAASLDIRIPADLGMSGITPKSSVEREWYLNGLDVVSRCCLAGMASGVEAIEPIRITKFPKKSRTQRKEVTPYLRPLSVKLTVRGTPSAVDNMLREIMRPGQRLSVAKAKISSLDQSGKRRQSFVDESLIVMDITVQALLVDPAGEPVHSSSGRM